LNIDSKIITQKTRKNTIAKWLATLAIWFLVISFLALIIFIIIKSIPGFTNYGFNAIFLSNQFITSDPNSHQASV